MVKLNSKLGKQILQKFNIDMNQMIKDVAKFFPNAEIVKIAHTTDEEDLKVVEDDKPQTSA